jgi:hypothetical protein
MVMEASGFDIKPTLTVTLTGKPNPARRHIMNETIPVACTLSTAGLAAQGKRWERLIVRTLTERAETPDGLRMSFHPDSEDELRALVAVETECCPWATWTVERSAETIVLDVRSTAEGVTALHAMFTPGHAVR